jgi:hypothetical protein
LALFLIDYGNERTIFLKAINIGDGKETLIFSYMGSDKHMNNNNLCSNMPNTKQVKQQHALV